MKFKTYQVEDGLSNNSINQIVNDISGGIWIATWDGLNYFDGNQFKVYKHRPGDSTSIAGNFIYDLLVDGASRLWIQSSSSSLSLKQGKQFRNFYFDDEIQEIGLDGKGDFLVEVNGQRFVWEKGELRTCERCPFKKNNFSKLDQLLERKYPDVEILSTHTDAKGQVWYATLRHGLFVLPNESTSVSELDFDNYRADLSKPYSIKSNEICAINEDVFGNVWLGLKDGGISMVFKNSGEVYSVYPHPVDNPHLPEETIRAITQDQSGQVWLGFYNSGLFVNRQGSTTFQQFKLNPNEPNGDWNRIRSLFTDHQGKVWVGTYGGVARISGKDKVDYFSSESVADLPNNRNYDFYEDREENCIWVACWGGLAKYSFVKESFESFEGQEQLSSFHIRQVMKAKGSLYLATEENGLLIWKNGKISQFTQKEGLLSNSLYALAEDQDTGNIWVATLGGVTIFHPEKRIIHKINEEDGLKSQLVYGVLPSDQHMWLSTTNGIARVDKKNYSVRTLPAKEGWQGAEFSEGAFFKSDRGMMFFGGVNGLNYFHPQHINLKDDLPILELEKPGENIWQALLADGTLDLKVKPVSFTQVPHNEFQYKLTPGNGQWITIGTDRRITVEGLTPGEYNLLLRNSLAEDADDYASMDFVVPRPIWRSPILWLASLLSLATALLLWRNHRSKIQKALLQEKIEERTRLISEQKAKLERINQDLDSKNKEINRQKEALLALHQRHKDADFEIEKFRNYLLGQFKLPLSELKESLEPLRTHSKAGKESVMQLVDQMMNQVKDWDKLSKLDQVETPKSLTIVSELMESIMKNMLPQFEKYGVLLKENFQLNDQWVELDVLKFKLFWQYLLREMLKYLEEGAELEITAQSGEREMWVELRVSSQLLVQNVDEIIQYSPYLKSAFHILKGLSGTIFHEIKGGELYVKVGIPLTELQRNEVQLNVRHWKHLDLREQLDPNRHHVILLGKKYESDSLVRIIHNEDFDIIVEDEVKMVISAIRNASIDALIIYNEKISHDMVELIEAVKARAKEKIDIPIIYIYDTIEAGFQDKLMDLGVETFIQLPASSRFILKKISTQLEKLQRYKSERNVLSLLPDDENTSYSSPNEKLVKQGLKIIREQLSNGDFKVEMLSEELGVSKIKCYRIFKEILGTSPSDLIISLKLEKAQKLLLQHKMNISEVSFACGFNDPKYFSKLFKRHFGQSPKHFQQPQEVG
ncbi:hybrid sensor histidine kinase/response regulator transcription factor [Echinicola sediminis]